MEMTDNLFINTQRLFTPEFVNKFSTALNLPAEKIHAGLRAIIPTFLSGMVRKGSSEVGAQSLVNMAREQNIDPRKILREIFGNDVSNIANSIGEQTGMNIKSVTDMMGMIAPMVMGVLNKKVRSDGLSAAGVMSYLNEQKPALQGFNIPQFINTSSLRSSADQSSFRGILVLLALCVGTFFWWIGPRGGEPQSQQMQEHIQTKAIEAAELSGLRSFIETGNERALPKRFSFNRLKFAEGKSTLLPGAEGELNTIAQVMKENPDVTARLEGFTDDTGNPILNEELSEARAERVKNHLVSKGVESNRLETEGKGSREPIANNRHEEGQALNRRVDFVILSL